MKSIPSVALASLFLTMTSCYLREHVDVLLRQNQRMYGPVQVIKARNSNNLSMDCCWCYLKLFRENEVNPYVSRALCEDLGETRGAECKKVKVIGGTCSFLDVAGAGGGMACDIRPLKYMEEGKIKAIAPPEGEFGPCYQEKARHPFADSRPDKRKKEKEAEKLNAPPKCEWLCGQDPERSANCLATLYNTGQSTFKETQRKPPGKICDAKTCSDLFADKFYALCPTFDDRECVNSTKTSPATKEASIPK